MSRFRRESNSAMASPKPVDESEGGGCGDHEEFALMHTRYKYGSKKKSERGEEGSSGEAERIGIRLFLAQNG